MSDNHSSNELVQAASPYLRSAAHQPVHWREWGEHAFAQARTQDKPILLDIGAVWCHWCHVMDRESYENPEVARLINEHYVAVKVDRDERPDIDSRYQTAVSALSGQGGWPLTAFLTPDGKPFYGGTYFPPEDQYGRPGMRRVLEAVAQSYKAQRTQVLENAAKISEALAGVGRFEGDPGAAKRKSSSPWWRTSEAWRTSALAVSEMPRSSPTPPLLICCSRFISIPGNPGCWPR